MTQDQQRTMVFNAIAEDDHNTEHSISEKLELPLDKVRISTDWLIRRGLVELRQGAVFEDYGHELTEKGDAVFRTRKPVGDALAELREAAAPQVTSGPTFNDSTVQYTHKNWGDVQQTNNIYNSGDMSRVLEIMRAHGDAETAAEVELLDQQGNQKGAVRKLLERLGEKSVDKMVDGAYAVAILPALTQLVAATGIF